MTINIEKLIKDIDEDNSGLIEYNEFKTLLLLRPYFVSLFKLLMIIVFNEFVEESKFSSLF